MTLKTKNKIYLPFITSLFIETIASQNTGIKKILETLILMLVMIATPAYYERLVCQGKAS